MIAGIFIGVVTGWYARVWWTKHSSLHSRVNALEEKAAALAAAGK